MPVFTGIIRFFTGSVRIYAGPESKDALMSFLISEGINAQFLPDEERGGIFTELSPRTLKKVAPALDKSGIIVYIINIYGFKRSISRYSTRYGLMLGAIAFLAFLWISTLFVWKVEVDGTELLSKEQVRAELKEMGVYPGRPLSGIDKSSVRNEFLSKHPELSWAALNFKGTTVSLTVKETSERPGDENEDCGLLVAKTDGIIRSILVYEGSAAVKEGSVVRKGDVLITGLISGSGLQITDNPILRFGNARGSVRAEVGGSAEVTVPYKETISTQTQGEKCGRTVSVFGFSFDFGSTSEGAVASSERNVTVFGVVELPITVRDYYSVTEKTETKDRSPDEAKAEAERRVYREISGISEDSELTRVKITYTQTEDGITARAEFSYITEITEPAAIGSGG